MRIHFFVLKLFLILGFSNFLKASGKDFFVFKNKSTEQVSFEIKSIINDRVSIIKGISSWSHIKINPKEEKIFKYSDFKSEYQDLIAHEFHVYFVSKTFFEQKIISAGNTIVLKNDGKIKIKPGIHKTFIKKKRLKKKRPNSALENSTELFIEGLKTYSFDW